MKNLKSINFGDCLLKSKGASALAKGLKDNLVPLEVNQLLPFSSVYVLFCRNSYDFRIFVSIFLKCLICGSKNHIKKILQRKCYKGYKLDLFIFMWFFLRADLIEVDLRYRLCKSVHSFCLFIIVEHFVNVFSFIWFVFQSLDLSHNEIGRAACMEVVDALSVLPDCADRLSRVVLAGTIYVIIRICTRVMARSLELPFHDFSNQGYQRPIISLRYKVKTLDSCVTVRHGETFLHLFH